MSELNYHHLRYFQVVAHEGHLTQAARRLHLSQSALSSQIRKLEERLGQPLFERRNRRLHLTEAGRIALDHADAIFNTGEELLAILSQRSAGRKVLRVGSMATLSRNYQLAFLQPVLVRNDVEVILRSGNQAELLDALASLHLDLVLTHQPAPVEDLSPFLTHRLSEQSVALVGQPSLCPSGLSLAERLQGFPLILPSRASGLRLDIDMLMQQLDITPGVVAEVDDMAMVRLLAREGIGLAIIPPIVVQDELDNGLLVVAATLADIRETFHAITVRRRYPNPILDDLLTRRMDQLLPASTG